MSQNLNVLCVVIVIGSKLPLYYLFIFVLQPNEANSESGIVASKWDSSHFVMQSQGLGGGAGLGSCQPQLGSGLCMTPEPARVQAEARPGPGHCTLGTKADTTCMVFRGLLKISSLSVDSFIEDRGE